MDIVIFIAFILIIIIALTLQPRFPKRVPDLKSLEINLTRLVASSNPPGVSIVAVKHNDIVYQYSIGRSSGTDNSSLSSHHVFHWWSMTKILTAIAIMQLQEHGKINIDDPVIKYLAWFSSTDQKNDLSAITIRQLLRHTSGLPDTIPAMIGWVHFEDEIYNQTEYLKRVMPKYGYLRFKPDKRAAYTNFGYLILGVIIEAVTGQSYDEYVLENILKQAGMDDSNFLYTPKMSDFEAYGSHPLNSIYTPMLPFLLDFKKLVEKWKGKTIWFKRLYHDVLPSSGLIGSPDDAAKFILTYMNSNKLLSESKKNSMLATGLQPAERPLGWAEYSLGDRSWVQHRGGGPGFASIMRIYPEEQLGIVIMANGTNLPAQQITEILANMNWV